MFCMLVLCFVGAMVSWKMDVMLERSLGNNTARHASFVAQSVEKQFRVELDGLTNLAELLTLNDSFAADIMQVQNKENGEFSIGLLDLSGRTVEGR